MWMTRPPITEGYRPMLARFTKIKNVGRFHDCGPGRLQFGKKVVGYGGNGNGKSTMTAICTSAASGDPKPVKSRKTFGAADDQEIEIVFDDGSIKTTIKFENGAWSASAPNL